MATEIYADELEKEIILMEQELLYKRTLLDECRKKLDAEILEHAKTKSEVNRYVNENKELQLQLEICLTGTRKLEEENSKNRDQYVKLQVQMSSYLNERQQLVDSCYQTEKANNSLKMEVEQLKEQLKGHVTFLNNITQRKTKTEALLNEIIKKQETLSKEQIRLENMCKEGLKFTEKLSEEAKFQAKFVQEAKIGQSLMEEEIIRLMSAVRVLKTEKENQRNEAVQSDSLNYLEEWKSQQKEMKSRNEELQNINEKLLQELSFTKEQVQILMNNYSKETIKNTNQQVKQMENNEYCLLK